MNSLNLTPSHLTTYPERANIQALLVNGDKVAAFE